MVTIRVMSKSTGKALEGKRVKVFFDGLFRGWIEGYTNSLGDADLNADPGNGTVYVSGDEVYKGEIRARLTVYA